jgi:predicted SprT family Zn-dependent metalloprotease
MCDETKDVSHFTKHVYSKDGYVHNCYDCSKTITNSKRLDDKKKGIRYKCGNCGTDYSRKDTLNKHLKMCKAKDEDS